MGKLVMFNRRNDTARPQTEPMLGDAKILIFTGVRYERGTPPPSTRLDPTRPKRKRG